MFSTLTVYLALFIGLVLGFAFGVTFRDLQALASRQRRTHRDRVWFCVNRDPRIEVTDLRSNGRHGKGVH